MRRARSGPIRADLPLTFRAVTGGLPPDPGRTARGGFEGAWQAAVALAIRVEWLVAVACYLGLAYDRTAPYAVGVLTGTLVVLGALGWLRWQAQPAAVRYAVARLARTDRRAGLVVALAAAGALALFGVVPAAMLGRLGAARAAVVLAAAATTAAAVAAARRRATQAAAGSAASG